MILWEEDEREKMYTDLKIRVTGSFTHEKVPVLFYSSVFFYSRYLFYLGKPFIYYYQYLISSSRDFSFLFSLFFKNIDLRF